MKNSTRCVSRTRRKVLILLNSANGIPSAILISMKIFQRIYVDGKLTRTAKPRDLATARQWMTNMEREWSRNLGPLTLPGEFDPNNGHEVTRVSPDELLVTTTGNKKLRIINVESK